MGAVIRPAEVRDSVAIAAIYRPYVERTHFTFEEVPPDAGEVALRMANPLHPWLVVEEEGRLLGYASTAPMRRARAARSARISSTSCEACQKNR